MATNVQDIVTALKNKMLGVSGLVDVYAYEPDAPVDGGYPFATVTQRSFDGQFGDTIRNIRTFTFSIRVYQERTQAAVGNEKAERLVREIIDETLTAFDADTTLSGTVKWVKPLRGDLSYIDREIGDTRVCELIVEATTIVPSTT